MQTIKNEQLHTFLITPFEYDLLAQTMQVNGSNETDTDLTIKAIDDMLLASRKHKRSASTKSELYSYLDNRMNKLLKDTTK